MIRTCCRALALSLFPIATAFSQSPATAAALPSDPAALLKLAAQVNGLHGDGLQPWHVHATWQTKDSDKIVGRGTFEEWWAAPHKFKVAITSAEGSRTTWDNGNGQYQLRSANLVAPQATRVQGLIVEPIRDASMLAGIRTQFETVHEKKKEPDLDCARENIVNEGGKPVYLIDSMGERRPRGLQYCFGDGLAAVRTRYDGFSRAAFNALVRFQGRFLARQILFDYGIGPVTEVSVDTIETLEPLVDAEFNPPAEAKLSPNMPTPDVSGSVIAANRIGGLNPEYPSQAKMGHIQGTVILQGTISPAGNVTDLQVVTSPPALQKAALDAVKTWRYKPILLNGQPVAVETQIDVVFRLSR